jgi:hypothetical protein
MERRREAIHRLSALLRPIVIGRSDSRVNDAVARTTATRDLHGVGSHSGEVEFATTQLGVIPAS